jgi:hypothetical protein
MHVCYFFYLVLKDSEAINDALQARELQILEDENRARSYLEALKSEKTTLAQQHAGLQERQNDLENLEKALEKKTQELEAKWESSRAREETLSQREITIQLREKSCEEREAKLLIKEATLNEQLDRVKLLPITTAKNGEPSSLNDSDVELLEKLTISVDEGEEIIKDRLSDVSEAVDKREANILNESDVELSKKITLSVGEGEEAMQSADQVESEREKGIESGLSRKRGGLSEQEKLLLRIDEELSALVKQAEEEEMDEPFEEEAVEALRIGAKAVAYKKKFYDVMSDKIVYFPSIVKSMVNYTLIEEAEKYYFDEEDEFPLVYSAALRSVAAMKLAAEDDDDGNDMDDDYMAKLALDVE